MAKNDVLLLDVLVEKAANNYGSLVDGIDEVFEVFCFEQVLKRYDLTYEDYLVGWTDGPDDGGIDGFFIFVDDHLVSGKELVLANRKNPSLTIEVFTVKHSDSFKLDPINSLSVSLVELLDLTKTNQELKFPFRDEIIEQRDVLIHVMRSLAEKHPSIAININYCCRGDVSTLADNISARVQSIGPEIGKLFSGAKVRCDLLGATELLSLYRKDRDYSLALRYTESYISREGGNYLILARLSDYFRFITDEEGKLRRYLFESNVRDYLGPVQVNQNISDTLANRANYRDEDFWWLNNGVTVLSTSVTVVGKELNIENVQIVNGLQTTETIHEFFSKNGAETDDRAVLVKILVAGDAKKQARIIKAANYQNSVDLSSLRGLDKVQRDIEQHLLEHDWYYDRRRNLYKNQGKPVNRIVSMAYLASAIRALALRDPAGSQRARSRSLRDEQVYDQIFSRKRALDIYLLSINIVRAVEEASYLGRERGRPQPIALAHFVAYFWVCESLRTTKYSEEQFLTLKGRLPSVDEVARIRGDMVEASLEFGGPAKRYDGIALSRDFINFFLSKHDWADLTDFPTVVSEQVAGLKAVEILPLESAIVESLRGITAEADARMRIAIAYESLRAGINMKQAGEGVVLRSFKQKLAHALRDFSEVDLQKKVRFIFVGIGIARSPNKHCDQSLALGYAATVCELLGLLETFSLDAAREVQRLKAFFRSEVERLRA